MMMKILLFFISIMIVKSDDSPNYLNEYHMYGSSPSCRWMRHSSYPEAYWINMDSSKDRRENMERHLQKLGMPNFRVKGVTLDDIHIPSDIESTWNHHVQAKYTSEVDTIEAMKIGKTFFLSGLFGRKKKNRLKELGCTLSHLLAIRRAVYSPTATSRYALILEDDVQFPFDVDFDALVKSAPPGFGILQLFNSNEQSMRFTWEEYSKSIKQNNNNPALGALWKIRWPKQAIDFWSTCAYLIDRDFMKPIVDSILVPQLSRNNTALESNVFDVKILAGVRWPCTPIGSPCCPNASLPFLSSGPCVFAPRGYQADSFIYATTINASFVFALPVITNGFGGNQSTFHQDHVVGIHSSAFQLQRNFINQMLTGSIPIPPFIVPACDAGLLMPPMEAVDSSGRCSWPLVRKSTTSPPSRQTANRLDTIIISSKPPTKEDFIKNATALATEKVTAALVTANTFGHLLDVFGTAAEKMNISSRIAPVRFLVSLKPDDLFIPSDLRGSWTTAKCALNSSWIAKVEADVAFENASPARLAYSRANVIVSGLCGRGRNRNSLDQISFIASHLQAIAASTRAYTLGRGSKFTLILEEDVQFPFDIDFSSLIASAPPGFGLLQLTSGEESALIRRFRQHARGGEKIYWEKRTSEESWSTTAYLIDNEVLRPIIDEVVSLSFKNDTNHLQYDMKLVAGLNRPCIPTSCCIVNGSSTLHLASPPCLQINKGLIIEPYMNALLEPVSYVSALPLLANGIAGKLRGEYNRQSRYESFHENGLRHQRRIINAMYTMERLMLPPFINPACDVGIEVSTYL